MELYVGMDVSLAPEPVRIQLVAVVLLEEAQALIGGRSAVIDAEPLPPAAPEEIEVPVEKTEE